MKNLNLSLTINSSEKDEETYTKIKEEIKQIKISIDSICEKIRERIGLINVKN